MLHKLQALNEILLTIHQAGTKDRGKLTRAHQQQHTSIKTTSYLLKLRYMISIDHVYVESLVNIFVKEIQNWRHGIDAQENTRTRRLGRCDFKVHPSSKVASLVLSICYTYICIYAYIIKNQ